MEEPDGVDSEKVEVDAKANEIDVKIGTVEMVKEKAEVPNIGEHTCSVHEINARSYAALG